MQEEQLKQIFKVFQGHSIEHAVNVEVQGKTIIAHILNLAKDIEKNAKIGFIEQVEKELWSVDNVEDRQRVIERLQVLRQRIRQGEI